MAQLYRKSALEKLSSPEQLDKMIIITPLSVWIAICAGIVLIATAVIWGFFGNISTTQSGSGLYFSMGAVRVLHSTETGIVTSCTVSVGDEVKAGDVLFRIKGDNNEEFEVYSDIDGYAYDIFSKEGSYVDEGTEMLQLREKNDTEAGYIYCYMPVGTARQIDVGMQAMVYPDYLNTKEYGYMVGRVTSVSQFLLNREDLESQIGNDDLINSLMSKGALLAVKCELEEDPETASGYRWSSKKGKDIEIIDETTVGVDFVVSQDTPIHLLLPGL